MTAPKLIPQRVPFTGEGFKGEKFLAITSVILTIVSSALLIHLAWIQREHTLMQMNEMKNKTS